MKRLTVLAVYFSLALGLAVLCTVVGLAVSNRLVVRCGLPRLGCEAPVSPGPAGAPGSVPAAAPLG